MVPVREPRTYSILLADELTLVREGLAALCDAQPGFRVIGQCSDGAAALSIIEAKRPDIAALDLNLPDLFALEVVRRVRDEGIHTKMVILSTKRDRKTLVDALRSGASGFVLKSAPAQQMMEAFGQVLDGAIYVSPELELEKIFCSGLQPAAVDPLQTLSTREFQVFSLLCEGLRAKEIAARLSVSPKTVDTYRSSMMRKLDIYDVAGLVKFAMSRNLLSK